MSRNHLSINRSVLLLYFLLNEKMRGESCPKIKLITHVHWHALQLLLFLNACKSDVDKTVTLIENFYRIKKSTPEFFANRNVESEAIKNCLKNQNYIALPVTPDNNVLIYHSLRNYDASCYNFDDAAKTYIMTSGEIIYCIQS